MSNRKIQTREGSSYLDVGKLVKFFGGRTELVRDLEKYEIVEITAAAVAKWQLRGQVPAARLMDLVTLAKLKGRRFNIHAYVERAAKVAAKKKAA